MLASLIGFTYVAIFMALVPGAGVALILRLSGRVGKKAACGAVLGIVISLAFWGVAVSFGIGALLHRYPEAFVWVRRAGCVYLGYLGVKIFLDSLKPEALDIDGDANETGKGGLWPYVGQALGIMLFNPELGMYDATFYSQFAHTNDNMLLMGLLFTLIEIVVIGVWYFLLSLALSSWKIWRNPNILVWADRIFGVLLLFLAIKGWK